MSDREGEGEAERRGQGPAAAARDPLETLLEYLRDARGFDFSGYERATLERHIRRRVGAVGVSGYEDYVDHLEANPREFGELFNAILINVITGFFEDADAWEHLRDEVLPELVAGVPEEEQIRVWSAGCASGEEAYTVAIALLELLGEEAFRRRVKIYATDIDEEALAEARTAVYPAQAFEEMPKELVERYFVESGRGFGFRPDLRRSVIFGRNELLQDAPISRIDLLICRNVLVYFTADAQARILSQLNFALRDRGFLVLGRSEMPPRRSDCLTPVDRERRVFRRVPRGTLGERPGQTTGEVASGDEVVARRDADLREAAASIGPVARLVFDARRFLVDANSRASELFGIGPAEIGRPFEDLEFSSRPPELREAFDRALEQDRPVVVGRVEWGQAPNERTFEVEIAPIAGITQAPLGAAITFVDVTELARLTAEHGDTKRRLETAYEELRSTVEELETTNEELQSTNGELETTNEELDRLNLFLEGILDNLEVGVAVVDRENKVQLWSARSHDLWGLRPDEVEGADILSLDLALPVETLREPLEDAISPGAKSTELTVDVVNGQGRSVPCEVRVIPLFAAGRRPFGGIVLMRELGESGIA